MSLVQNDLSAQEQDRLKDLASYEILDTEAEESFDEITRLVAETFEAPVALITLVDQHRQWFKSAHGLTDRETPRQIAFCDHAIRSPGVLVVPDATKDSRFADNPLVVAAPNVRFYAGAPLETPQGHRIGTLCVIDVKAREIEEKQKRLLSILSRQVVIQLEQRKGLRQRGEFHRLIEKQKILIAESSKLAALGEMAAGIAHEINNPLAIMQVKVGLLRRFADQGRLSIEKISDLSDSLESLIGRVAKIVKGLKSFAREGSTDALQSVSMRTVISETLAFCQERIRNRAIQLEIDIPASPELNVLARQVQVSQILLNLLNNAYDAVEGQPKPYIKIEVIESSAFIEIAVSDSGPPIALEIRQKIFEPFFTTKNVGQGTGLGLSVSKGLAESNGGRLYLDDDAVATRFVLRLPKLF